MTEVPSPLMFPAAQRWAELLDEWGVPADILAQAPESPWSHEPTRFAVDRSLDRTGVSARWAREVLPPVGGTVLDVGCGGGRASLALVPPANEVIGVDSSGAMLDLYLGAAAEAGVARRTFHGSWPDIADVAPSADVVVCHHVAYNVADIVPFLWALTEHARLAVVVEITTVHPMSAWAPAWRHFWRVERPAGPTSDDLVAVLREIGLDPEHTTSARRPVAADDADGADLVRIGRRRLCLSADRDSELADWLALNPVPWAETMATIRWPGAAQPIV